MDPLVLSLIVFLGVACGVGAMVVMLGGMQATKAEERLHVITGHKTADSARKETRKLVRESLDGVSSTLARWFSSLRNLGLLLEQADSPLKADMFLGVSFVFAGLGLAGAIIAKSPEPMLPVAAICAGLLPLMWLFMRRAKRFKKFGAQLPDALELISRALRSGHSLASGLNAVVNEMPNPIAKEFNMAYEEQNLGVPLEQALKSMLKRMPNMDLKFFVTAVAIQRQSGGDLAEILDKIGYIVRERFRILGAVQALTGEGRISGIVLMALPIALFFAVYQMNPDYVMLLFTDELGRKMLAGAAVLQVMGAICIKKIVNIKV
ncbi:MAG: type II secretion system F family protein [Planctomycetales bacterium]